MGLFADNSENNSKLSNYNFGSSQIGSSSSESRQDITGGNSPSRNETNNLPFSSNSSNKNVENNTNLNLNVMVESKMVSRI